MARRTGYRYSNGKEFVIVNLDDSIDDEYTLTSNDNGRVLVVDSAVDFTINVSNTLTVGFNCVIVQIGAGQVTVAESSTTIENALSQNKTSGQWAEVSLVCVAPDLFILAGSTGA